MDKQKLKAVLRGVGGPVDVAERVFLEQIAGEIKNATDARMKRLVEWCGKSAEVLQQCGGDKDKQALHAAIMGSNLHVSLNYIEDSGDVMDAYHPDLSPWTNFDRNCMIYEFYVDVERKVVGIKAIAVHVLTAEPVQALEFQPMEFPLTVPVERFAHLQSPILVAP